MENNNYTMNDIAQFIADYKKITNMILKNG